MMNRRKFLAITASLAAPCAAGAATWQGRAFGSDINITIHAPRDVADAALEHAQQIITEVEGLFSLYDTNSDLSQLNRRGFLYDPDPRFLSLMLAADNAYQVTDGRFDPTIQPVWAALAKGEAPKPEAVGWDRVQFDESRIVLDENQSLTFNGIAQGFATDLVADAFARLGLNDVLVNIGEYRGHGGPWTLGISDPNAGFLGHLTLTEGAIATSSPTALSLGLQPHILLPGMRALWSTVSVAAPTAVMADALSTGLCLADREVLIRVAMLDDVYAIKVVDFAGNLITFG